MIEYLYVGMGSQHSNALIFCSYNMAKMACHLAFISSRWHSTFEIHQCPYQPLGCSFCVGYWRRYSGERVRGENNLENCF